MRYFALITIACFSAAPAFAADMKSYDIIIKDHVFSPSSLEVPASEKIKLMVKNQDATAEEFESSELKREKIIKGNSEAIILVGPLKAGEYPFFGDFHEKTAQGKLIAK